MQSSLASKVVHWSSQRSATHGGHWHYLRQDWSYLSVDVKNRFSILESPNCAFPAWYRLLSIFSHLDLERRRGLPAPSRRHKTTASLYLPFTADIATAWGSIDYLKELHFHCLDDGPSSSFQLRLAIEPPRPRQVCLSCISFDQIRLDWTRVSSLTLVSSDIRMPLLR